MNDDRAMLEARAAGRIELERRRALGGLTLERLLTSPDLAAHDPSPTQLALVRALDGSALGDALPPDRVAYHFGASNYSPTEPPRFAFLRCGVRAGKSLISALDLLRSALTCDMSQVRSGEYVRAPFISARLETSKAGFHHLVGTMQARPTLRALMVGEPGATSFTARRPHDGREVVISLTAASASGTNTRSTWLAGCMLDEADFFDGEGLKANLGDQFRAIVPRLLPGARLLLPSSPWAREGFWFEEFERWFGKPGRYLAFHSDSLSMNPTLPVEDIEQERRRDPDNAAREYDGIPLSVNNERFFPVEVIGRCLRAAGKDVLPPIAAHHTAATDLALTKNSTALAISRVERGKAAIAYHDEHRPVEGESPKFSENCRRFAETCLDYGVTRILGDHFLQSMATEEFRKVERGKAHVSYVGWTPNTANVFEAFSAVKRMMLEGKVELPNDPRLVRQFEDVKSQPTPGGQVRIQLPKHGRAHGDVLMAAVLSLSQLEHEVLTGKPPAPTKPIEHHDFGLD